MQKLSEEFPRNARYRQDVGQSWQSLYGTLLAVGRMTEAEDACRQGLAVREKLSNDFPNDPEYCEHVLESQGSLSWFYRKTNKLNDSLMWRTTELDTFKRLPAKRTESGWARRELRTLLNNEPNYSNRSVDLKKRLAIGPRPPILRRRAASR